MRKFPIGIQDFRELREDNYLYIDKTRVIYHLIEDGKYFFLSRPRRFGKSLLLSTLKYLFLGEKDLFKGLWIEGKYEFEPHPSFTIHDLNWMAILFQTGYLTILDYDASTGLYTLGYPNREVRDTMQQHLLAAFRETTKTDSLPLLVQIMQALEKGDIEETIDLINILFSTIPHQLFEPKKEAFFHAILHLAFSGIGIFVESEVSTSKGRVDTVVHTKQQIVIIEFKLDGSASSALKQIREKRYGSPYLGKGKEVLALGVNFSSATKEVAEWEAVPYESLLVEG